MMASTRMAMLLVVVMGFMNQQRVMSSGSGGGGGEKCDLYKGSWVYDPSYPLYQSETCSFIQKQFNCRRNGRLDTDYLKFRWQPSNCLLPRFNGQDFIARMRGKSVMFVGDSLSLNQWQSLTCMLHNAVPNANFTITRDAFGVSTFFFPAYDTKIMFSRNAFLVDIVGKAPKRVLKLDSISSGSLWKSADILIFNSWHWWLHTGRKQPWDYIEEGSRLVRDMNRLMAFEKAMGTWAKWIDTNIDPSRTKVLFQGVSPDHANSKDWSASGSNSCIGETTPVKGSTYPAGPHPAEVVVEKVVRTMKKPVRLLDVTLLSQLRKDGHPSVYGLGGHRVPDCSHWCLAGVPDTWNQLFYAELVRW